MWARIQGVGRIVQHGATIDPQSERIRVGGGAAVVVDDGLDDLQSRRDVVVADGAGGRLPQAQRDRVAVVLGAADAVPGARGIAGRAAAF